MQVSLAYIAEIFYRRLVDICNIRLVFTHVELGHFFEYDFTIVVEWSWLSFLIPSGYLPIAMIVRMLIVFSELNNHL